MTDYVEPPAIVEEAPEPRDEKKGRFGSMGIQLGARMLVPDLHDVVFTGSGVPQNGLRRVDVAHTGRELGMSHPTFFGYGASIYYTRRYFALGLDGAIYFIHPGGDTNAIADTTSAVAWTGGFDIAAAIPLDEKIAVRIGPELGWRGISVPLEGFKDTTCTSRGHTYSCPETVDTSTFFVEPRVRLEIDPWAHVGVVVGAFTGYEVVGGAFTAGLFVGGHLASHSDLPP